MKPFVNARRGLFVFMLTAVCVYPVESARILNEPDGFNGYRWGTTVDSYPELRPVRDKSLANQLPNVKVYEDAGSLLLNGVKPDKIYYRFSKGRLGSIELRYQGRDNREKLRQWIEDTYGRAPVPERKQKHIEWHGENTVISLGYDLLSDRGQLWFIYLPDSPFASDAGGMSGPQGP